MQRLIRVSTVCLQEIPQSHTVDKPVVLVCLFDFMLYVPVNRYSHVLDGQLTEQHSFLEQA